MENYKAVIRKKSEGSNKGLLKKGLVPGIIYGKGTEPKKIAFEDKILKKLMSSGSFYTKIIDLEIDGELEKILPKDLQYHPVTDRLIHFDFLRVKDDTKVTVEVPVEFLNQDICPGIKKGGVLNLVRRLVELVSNANQIPEKLIFDLKESEIGDAVKISNINLPEGVTPTITDRDFVIATLVPPTVEVEETKTEEDSEEEKEETSEEKDKTEENKEKPDDKKEEKKEESK
tara:strand:+ start:647 stop:1336 length:690 start_codon:yes stop_codon:yes gene_type:complete